MLTADLIRPFLRTTGRILSVDQVEEHDPLWLQTAADLIALFRGHVGHARAEWDEARETYEGTRVDYLRIRGLAKVLEDASTFLPRPLPFDPRELREWLFQRGPAFALPDLFHPASRNTLLQEAAATFQLPLAELEEALFADHPGAHLLVRQGPDWTPQSLLERYNLELARGALYRAIIVQVDIYDHFKEMWRYLKLFKIMYAAKEQPGGGYQVRLSGPLSDFVETERYGISFAEFFPALLLGDRWNLVARVKPSPRQGREQPARMLPQEDLLLYRLNQNCGLHSHYRRGRMYDSALERTFASEFEDFEAKFGERRGKWRLSREEQILVFDGTVMIPDFLLVHTQDEQRRILIELVGFWSPSYLKNKIAKVQAARCPNLLLLVYENLRVTREDFGETPSTILFFKEKPVLKEVMAAVEEMAEKLYGPPPVPRPEAPPLLADLLKREDVFPRTEEIVWHSLDQLGTLLRQSEATFTPRRYGYPSLSALMKDHPELFEMRRGKAKGHPWEVRVLSQKPTIPNQSPPR